MELAHVAARPNLDFRQCDLFAPAAAAELADLARPAAACVAIGTHIAWHSIA
jgi:hypothetical protein